MSTTLFQARYEVVSITEITPGTLWQLYGRIYDSSGSGFSPADASVGNLVFDEDLSYYVGTTNCWKVSDIVAAGPGTALTVQVVYNETGDPGGLGQPLPGSSIICAAVGTSDLSQVAAPGWTQVSETLVNAVRNYDNRKDAGGTGGEGATGPQGATGPIGETGATGAASTAPVIYLDFQQASAPTGPSIGDTRIFASEVGKLYIQSSTGPSAYFGGATGPTAFGNISGSVSLTLEKDMTHTASITGAVTDWTIAGLIDGDSAAIILTNAEASVVATTGLTAWIGASAALTNIATDGIEVIVKRRGDTYYAIC